MAWLREQETQRHLEVSRRCRKPNRRAICQSQASPQPPPPSFLTIVGLQERAQFLESKYGHWAAPIARLAGAKWWWMVLLFLWLIPLAFLTSSNRADKEGSAWESCVYPPPPTPHLGPVRLSCHHSPPQTRASMHYLTPKSSLGGGWAGRVLLAESCSLLSWTQKKSNIFIRFHWDFALNADTGDLDLETDRWFLEISLSGQHAVVKSPWDMGQTGVNLGPVCYCSEDTILQGSHAASLSCCFCISKFGTGAGTGTSAVRCLKCTTRKLCAPSWKELPEMLHPGRQFLFKTLLCLPGWHG